jgi:hypothetical protein
MIVEKATSNKYSVVLNDGSIREVERNNLVRLIDLTSKELACLMKKKNERHASTPKQYSSMQSKESKHTFDQGYEPEAEPSSSENSYENNIKISPADTNENTVLALPCAVEMVEAKTEDETRTNVQSRDGCILSGTTGDSSSTYIKDSLG